MKVVQVDALPFELPAEEARLQLKAAARLLHIQAAEAHAEGMSLEGQSVRIDQLAHILCDEEVVRMRDLFIAEGVMSVEKPVDLSSPGGNA